MEVAETRDRKTLVRRLSMYMVTGVKLGHMKIELLDVLDIFFHCRYLLLSPLVLNINKPSEKTER